MFDIVCPRKALDFNVVSLTQLNDQILAYKTI
ncbi:hypothetical protein EMIT0194P_60186 [Pseudomonas serbica]